MTRSLSTRLYVSFFVYLGLILALSLSCTSLLRTQRDDGLVVNLSGRQRMLTQRMTHQLLRYAMLAGEGHSTAEAREAVLATMRVFETTLTALERGGPAPIDLQMASLRDVPAGSADVRRQILRVQQVWRPFREQARSLLESHGTSQRSAVEHLVLHNTELLAEMDAVVVLMQREAEGKVAALTLLQYEGLGVAVLITLLLVWFVYRSVSTPLRELTLAAREMSLGNLYREVPVGGPEEIASLGHSFERLRQSLRSIVATRGSTPPPYDQMDRELWSIQS